MLETSRRRTTWVAAVSISIAAALAAGRAHAYCRATTETPVSQRCPSICVEEGAPFYWPTRSATYSVNQLGFPDLDDATLRSLLARSFGHWLAADCGPGKTLDFELEQAPGTTSLKAGPRDDEPNDNAVAWLSAEEWDDSGYDPYAFAFTFMWYEKGNGRIRGSDMLFNGGQGKLTICPEQGCQNGEVDFENVATHEAGHFFGLSHSSTRDSTMYCGAMASETKKRSLELDDVEGICTIYGRSPSGSDSCALEPGRSSKSLFVLLLWLSLTALLGRRRLRRTRHPA